MSNGGSEWLELLKQRDVLKEGHFLLTSGKHTAKYLQCALLFQQPRDAERVGQAMANPFHDQQVDVVIGPAMGGVVAAHEVARALSCRAIFTEREDGRMTLRRGFQLEAGERVVVVEDVVTTGGSVKEVLAVVEDCSAEVVGITSVVNRHIVGSPFSYPFYPLVTLHIETYEPDMCPLCASGAEPAIKPGSRKVPTVPL